MMMMNKIIIRLLSDLNLYLTGPNQTEEVEIAGVPNKLVLGADFAGTEASTLNPKPFRAEGPKVITNETATPTIRGTVFTTVELNCFQ